MTSGPTMGDSSESSLLRRGVVRWVRQDLVQLAARAGQDVARPVQLGGGAEAQQLTQLPDDLGAQPAQFAGASAAGMLPGERLVVVLVLLEPRAAGVGQLELLAAIDVAGRDEPFVLELGERRVDRTRTRPPAAACARLVPRLAATVALPTREAGATVRTQAKSGV